MKYFVEIATKYYNAIFDSRKRKIHREVRETDFVE